jgi:hypothetical protein
MNSESSDWVFQVDFGFNQSKESLLLFSLITPIVATTPITAPEAARPVRPASHCTAAESTAFSCTLTNGKNVSICSTPNFEETMEGQLVYRYGKLGAVELSYPENPALWQQSFQAERYTRPMPMATTDLRLRFERNDWSYTVYQTNHCEPKDFTSDPALEDHEVVCSDASGLIVRHPKNPEMHLSCSSIQGHSSKFFKLVFALELVIR